MKMRIKRKSLTKYLFMALLFVYIPEKFVQFCISVYLLFFFLEFGEPENSVTSRNWTVKPNIKDVNYKSQA